MTESVEIIDVGGQVSINALFVLHRKIAYLCLIEKRKKEMDSLFR